MKNMYTRSCLHAVSAVMQGVPLNQGNLAASLANIIATYELTAKDKSLVVMPLFHVHGLMAGKPDSIPPGVKDHA